MLKARVGYSRLPRTVSIQVFNTSKDGDSTTSLGHLFQCLTMLTVKKLCLMFKWHLLYFSLCPWPLVLSQDTTEKSLALSPLLPSISQYTLNNEISLDTSLLQAELCQLSQSLLL